MNVVADLPTDPRAAEPVQEGEGTLDAGGLLRLSPGRSLSRPCGQRHWFVPEIPFSWNRIWQRAHMTDDGMPNPHLPAD
ncbi:hypothetical protein [Streptomyces sp. NPDC056169]|uniref:hypothetical protein n=1 Tax=Streptomyces sp. NPDC056169 TaxID=3345734 RepID=UPI0035DD1836